MASGDDNIDSRVHRFSTDDFPKRDGLAQWCATCGRTMMKVDMDPLGDEPFQCAAELRQLPRLGLASITTTPNRLRRSRELIADGNDDFIFVIPTLGGAEISQHKRDVPLATGRALLIPSDEPSSTVIQSRSRFVSLAIPAAILRPLVAGLDAALMPVIPDNTEAVRLLLGYLACLRDDIALSAPETRHAVVNHVHDLVALAVGAIRDAAHVAHGRGMPAARLAVIKADIDANLADPALSADVLGPRHGVTPRYVRKLFESEGLSVSAFILERRLARAHRILADWRGLGRTISAIAFDCGFGDLSYFNRTFRRRYGATPSDLREQAGQWKD